MRTRKSIGLGLLALWVMSASAAETPPIPGQPDLKRYESVPAPWRDYLLQARAAERIADPLQRCLAFPDLPGNKWPEGHSRAHCLIHHEAGIPTVAEIGARLDRGELPQLEASMQQVLDRHYSGTDYSEAIHELFNYRFNAGEEAKQVAERWLKLAPDSAYANLAYASHLSSAALDARGTGFMAETPREDVRRMSELAGRSVPYYQKAIRINPRLIAAYTGLHQIATIDSRSDLEQEAFSAASKLDPACAELANVHMRSITPRWGGDYDQMLSYANALSAHVARRPQLAVQLAKPYGDRGSILLNSEQFDRETDDVLEIAVRTGSDEDSLLYASDAARRIEKNENKAAAYLLQASRFKDLNADAAVILSWHLVRLEPALSVRYALMALKEAPGDGFAHYVAGAGYFNSRMYDAADAQYRLAIERPENRQASLREAAEMWLLASVDPRSLESRKAGALRAKPYIDRLVAEYPEDGRGWIMKVIQGAAVDPHIDEADIAELRAVVKKVDRSDPWQAQRVEGFEAKLKQIDAFEQQKRHRK